MTCIEYLKSALINTIELLMMSAKFDTPRLLKLKIFGKNGYEVIFFVHDVTNKLLVSDSNSIEDALM